MTWININSEEVYFKLKRSLFWFFYGVNNMSLIGSFIFSEVGYSEDEEIDQAVPIILPEIRNRYVLDNKCTNCLINFNILGLAHTQKSKCLFCYRGVCFKCLAKAINHPETNQKEKMCKSCTIERYKCKNIKRKIEALKLEQAQVSLELELATKEKEDYSKARKQIQEELKKIKQTQNMNSAQLLENLEFHKDLQKRLKVRKNYCELKEIEFEENFDTLQISYEKFKSEVKDLKIKLAQKDATEKKMKEKTKRKKEQSLIILQKYKNYEHKTNQVIDLVNLVKAEIHELETKISEFSDKIVELEAALYSTAVKQQSHGSVLMDLNEKISICKSVMVDENDLTEEEKELLNSQTERLKKYDQIVETMHARINLLNQKNQELFQDTYSERIIDQSPDIRTDLLLEKTQESTQMMKNENLVISYNPPSVLTRTDPLSNIPTKDYRSSGACNKCLIS